MDFTQDILPYINSTILILGGWFLKRIIEDKNSQIETLKTNIEANKELLNSTKILVEMYDIQKFKEHLDFTVKNLDEKHKTELEKVFTHFEKVTKEQILKLVDSTSPWLIKYQELLNYQFHFLLQMSDEELEKVYKHLPENKEFIQYQIKAIKETGNVKDLPKK